MKPYLNFKELEEEINKRGISDPRFFGGGYEGPYRILQNNREFAEYIHWLKEKFNNGIPNYLEIGTATGGNIRTVYELVGFDHAFSIDLDAEGELGVRAANLAAIPAGIHTLWEGNSHSMEAHIALRLSGQKFDVAFIDGDHFGPGVQMDVELAYGYMKPDSYMVFHDVVNPYWIGVMHAVQNAIKKRFLVPVLEIRNYDVNFGIQICRVNYSGIIKDVN